jgi:hypothetical protein
MNEYKNEEKKNSSHDYVSDTTKAMAQQYECRELFPTIAENYFGHVYVHKIEIFHWQSHGMVRMGGCGMRACVCDGNEWQMRRT